MEVTFDNPGHREALQQLGILRPNELGITVDDLVDRTIETGNIEPVVYLLRQEIATNAQALLFVDDKFERAKREVSGICDKDSFQKAENRLGSIERILERALGQDERMATAAIKIVERTLSDDSLNFLLTPEIEEHLETIHGLINRSREILEEKGEIFSSEVREFRSTLNFWKTKF